LGIFLRHSYRISENRFSRTIAEIKQSQIANQSVSGQNFKLRSEDRRIAGVGQIIAMRNIKAAPLSIQNNQCMHFVPRCRLMSDARNFLVLSSLYSFF
jgi:hypothetical protein